MLISQEKRCLFVHIQKTAGSSIAAALQTAIPDMKSFLGTHDTAWQARCELGPAEFDDLFSAAFVRNPWDRLVSWYTMIIHARGRMSWWRRVRQGPVPRLWEYVYENSNSFEEFVLRCTADVRDFDGRKSLCLNQFDYIADHRDRVLVNFIGRYESLTADSARLFAHLDLPGLSLPHINRSAHKHYSAYYTDALAEVVRRRYARDIEVFGYEFQRMASPETRFGHPERNEMLRLVARG
jgi:hypothetical protein